jgi:hypothetical protein
MCGDRLLESAIGGNGFHHAKPQNHSTVAN